MEHRRHQERQKPTRQQLQGRGHPARREANKEQTQGQTLSQNFNVLH